MYRFIHFACLAAVALATSGSLHAQGPRPADYPTLPGTYQIGAWEYSYAIEAPGTRSEKRVGVLKRDGSAVPGQAEKILETPLGRFRYFEQMYSRGWLNTLSYDRAVFETDQDVEKVLKGSDEFARELYGRLAAKEGNGFFSPQSIHAALAMTYAGARGETARQMAKVLHAPADPEKFHPAVADASRRIFGFGLPSGHELFAANSIWVRDRLRLTDEFSRLMRDFYGATLYRVNFAKDPAAARQRINHWVEQHTNDRIKDLLQPDQVTRDTGLILTNALYFKGAWLDRFSVKQTQPRDFHLGPDKVVSVPMMQQTGQFRYADRGAFKVLELPYEGEATSMLVFLPSQPDGLPSLEANLLKNQLSAWLRGTPKQSVVVGMPRFRLTSTYELKPVLAELGMTDAFSSAADFSGMTGKKELFIGAVAHKAFLDVNEDGTEAAAATAVVMLRSARPQATFIVDRPFVLLIRDNRTGTVLFMGRVVNPTAKS